MEHPIKIEEGIILAGGFGTRLQPVIHDLPKPMAPINGKPFLEYLLRFLKNQHCRHCVLSVGYKHESISAYFGNQYFGMELDYAVETEPLGTGGGIKNGLHLISQNDFLLLNGDSFFDVDLAALSHFHFHKKSAITLSVKEVQQTDRYGTLDLEHGRVIRFNEKQKVEKAFINGGVYIVSKNVFNDANLGKKFSFEKDILEKKTTDLPIYALPFDGYFIDIGIPSDYEKAQMELDSVVRTTPSATLCVLCEDLL